MKRNILYFSTDSAKVDEIVIIINRKEHWHGLAASSQTEAVKKFLEHPIDMLIFGCNVRKETEYELSDYFRKIKPDIIVLDPFGGGTELLLQEIAHAFKNYDFPSRIS